MDLFIFALQHDWPVLLPIFVCSVALLAVGLNRQWFYSKNQRDVVQFIQRLQRELQTGQMERGQLLSQQVGGVIGEVSEEGLQILSNQRESFSRSFDITISLAVRKLEQWLPVIGTIGTIAPYLGLFGTVVRILLTFGDLSNSSGNTAAPEIMFGIGSALIATAYGLIVAIIAVALNNYFRSVVSRFEDDFQLLKLVFLNFSEPGRAATSAGAVNQQQVQRPVAVGQQPAAPGMMPGSLY